MENDNKSIIPPPNPYAARKTPDTASNAAGTIPKPPDPYINKVKTEESSKNDTAIPEPPSPYAAKKETDQVSKKDTAGSMPANYASEKISYSNYLKIQMGMSPSEVAAILGSPDYTKTEEVAGREQRTYTWKGSHFNDITVTIENNRVVSAFQSEVWNITANISKDKYDKLQSGMTYEQVKSILGEGELLTHMITGDIESHYYFWMNSSGNHIACDFTGNKLEWMEFKEKPE